MIKAFSASPTPVPFGEVYTALQQKTVDGQENPIPTIFSRKFYEVQGVLAMTRHMLQNNMIVINKDSLARLKPEHREVLFAEAARASAMNTYLQQKREASMLEEIRKSGRTKIIEDVDRDAFAEQGHGCHAGDGGALGQGQSRPPHGGDRNRPQALTGAMPLPSIVRRLDDWSSRAEEGSSPRSTHRSRHSSCAAVVFRYILNDPLTWSEELILVLFGWMIFLGIANAFRVRTHIIIDVVVLFAPRVVGIALGYVAFVATASVLCVLTWYAWRYMLREMPNATPMLGISAAWAIAPLVVCGALSLLHLLRNLMDDGVAGALWSDITTRE